MANNCYNEFKIKCTNTAEAQKVLSTLNEMYDQGIVRVDDCMKHLSITVPTHIDLRDYIWGKAGQDGDDDRVVYFRTESAWAPQPNTWRNIINTISPTAKVFFYAEEPGQGIFQTNNPDYLDKYYVDIYLEEEIDDVEEGVNIYTTEEVIVIAQKLLCTSENDLERLIDLVNTTDWGDSSVSIYPIEHFDFMDYKS